MPSPAQDKLHAIGIDSIAEQIYNGATYGEIAEKAGVSRHALNDWLATHHPARDKSAREESAEAWLDIGLDAVQSSMRRDSGIDPNAAKALEVHCARRAAIRNRLYREKTDSTLAVTISPLQTYLSEVQAKGIPLPIHKGITINNEDV